MKGAAEINDTLCVREAVPGGLVLERDARRAALSLSILSAVSLSLSLSLSLSFIRRTQAGVSRIHVIASLSRDLRGDRAISALDCSARAARAE